MKEQQTTGLFPFCNMGQGPTHVHPGPYLPMVGVEQFGHLARTQLQKWEDLVSDGNDYAERYSAHDPEEYRAGEDLSLGADIQTVIREADHCWQRKWIAGIFHSHPVIQTHAELRSWCQLQFEALRVLDDRRAFVDYRTAYEGRPLTDRGRKRKVSWHWSCDDTIRLALPALYQLDLPTTTRTDALVRVLEDRHFSD